MKYINLYKQMRMILIYDLPMIEDMDRKLYGQFHKKLKKLGFYMIQYSVYTKVLQNDSTYLQMEKKLAQVIPSKGNIVIMQLTEKQFQNLKYVRGEKNRFESIVGGKELVVFGGDEE